VVLTMSFFEFFEGCCASLSPGDKVEGRATPGPSVATVRQLPAAKKSAFATTTSSVAFPGAAERQDLAATSPSKLAMSPQKDSERWNTENRPIAPLPHFKKDFACDDESTSCGSSDVGTMTEDRWEMLADRQDTSSLQDGTMKQILRVFIREMVKGRSMEILTVKGTTKMTQISLGRRLDVLKVKARGKCRRLPLADVLSVHVGFEPEDIDTPLEELSVTLCMGTGECLTLNLESIDKRDEFARCLRLICGNKAKRKQ